jgi:2-oxoglutarate ferredoxin oxidoreductase subunit alpha
MQLAGAQLARVSARMGNAVCCSPDFPAEIRAPAGTLAGVSGFQVHFSSLPGANPGDCLDALVAMNPAALLANVRDLRPGGILVVNSDSFTAPELAKAGYSGNPFEDGSLTAYREFCVPMDTRTREAVIRISLTPRDADRCKNFFALGLVCWLFDRSTEPISRWVKTSFGGNPAVLEANLRALKAGYKYCDEAAWPLRYSVPKAPLPAGQYRNLTGGDALVLGLQTAARLAGRSLVFAGTPMTPASELFQPLLQRPRHDALAIQAEDESAAAAMALGASFGGAIGATATSGPGLCQAADVVGLAVMTELPLVVIDVQRGGPSVGLPTKTEQTDLLQSLFGRNGECPAPVLAPATPGDGFAMALEAARLACKFMTPVIVLTDVFVNSGSEPWRIPAAEELPQIGPPEIDPSAPVSPDQRNAWLARPWDVPGMPGREHRIGGLEKDRVTGAVSYDPVNHETMVRLRAEKIAGIADDIPDLAIDGPAAGDLLVLGWGSTFGAIAAAVHRARRGGAVVAHAHLRYLNPLPRNLGSLLQGFRRVLVPELNRGQLLLVLRSRFSAAFEGMHKIQGRPFLASEIEEEINRLCRPTPR